jgi:hypothetical protein
MVLINGESSRKLRVVTTTNLLTVMAYLIQMGNPSYFIDFP